MLWLSKNDLKNFFGEVTRNVAKELNVSEWEWLFHSELLEQIKAQDSMVARKLESFFSVYKNCHNFHVKVEKEGRAGKLSLTENDELQTLISVRHVAREALLKELRK